MKQEMTSRSLWELKMSTIGLFLVTCQSVKLEPPDFCDFDSSDTFVLDGSRGHLLASIPVESARVKDLLQLTSLCKDIEPNVMVLGYISCMVFVRVSRCSFRACVHCLGCTIV